MYKYRHWAVVREYQTPEHFPSSCNYTLTLKKHFFPCYESSAHPSLTIFTINHDGATNEETCAPKVEADQRGCVPSTAWVDRPGGVWQGVIALLDTMKD